MYTLRLLEVAPQGDPGTTGLELWIREGKLGLHLGRVSPTSLIARQEQFSI
jgi:hypothetical protein